MDERLKRRLVGAVVLVSLAVIFLPMLVEERADEEVRIEQTNIPPRPKDEGFQSSIVALPEDEPLIPPLQADDTADESAEQEPEPNDEPQKPRVGLSAWVVQVASLSSRDNAYKLVDKLKANGHSAFVEQISVKGRDLYRVRVGPEIDRKRAERTAEAVRKLVDLKGQVIRYP